MSTYGTKWVETEALLAAQEGDAAEIDRLLAMMLPGEMDRLLNACVDLVTAIRARRASARGTPLAMEG